MVPSAPGKAPEFPDKITDMLYTCAYSYNTHACEEVFAQIEKRYLSIIRDLQLDLDLNPYLHTVLRNIKAGYGDHYAASRGEYLNGVILAKYLGFDFIDPADCIAFDENGQLDEAPNPRPDQGPLGGQRLRGDSRVLRQRQPGRRPHLQPGRQRHHRGYRSPGGGGVRLRKLDRCFGFLMTDPGSWTIPRPSNASPTASCGAVLHGASVLHDEAIFPVRVAGIPINIRNTNDPSHPGTMILPSLPEEAYDGPVTGIAGKKGLYQYPDGAQQDEQRGGLCPQRCSRCWRTKTSP